MQILPPNLRPKFASRRPETLLVRIVSNVGYQLLNGGLGAIISVVHTGLISRYLGVAGYGAFSLVFAHVLMFYGLTGFGADTIAVRKMAQHPDGEAQWLGDLLTFRVALAGGAYLLCLVFLREADYPALVVRGILVYAAMILFSPYDALLSVYMARLRTGAAVIISLIVQVTFLAVTYLLIHEKASFSTIILSVLIGTAARSFLVGLPLMKYLKTPIHVSWRKWVFLAREGLPLGLGSLCAVGVDRFALYLLQHYHGIKAVGFYAASWRVVYFLNFIPQAVVSPLYPLFSRYWDSDRPRLHGLFEQATLALLFVAVPLAAAGYLKGDWLLTHLFGSKFFLSSLSFRVLMLNLLLNFTVLPAGYLMIAAGRQHINLILNSVSSIVGILLLLVLIPRFSIVGAAWASVGMQSLLVGATFVYVTRMGLRVEWDVLSLALTGGVLVLGAVKWFGSTQEWIGLSVGLGLYVVSVVAFWIRFGRERCASFT